MAIVIPTCIYILFIFSSYVCPIRASTMSLPMYVAFTDSIPVCFFGVLLNSSVPMYVAYTDSIPVHFLGVLLNSSVCRDNKKFVIRIICL